MKKVKDLLGKIKTLDKKKKILLIVLACVLVLAIAGGIVAAVVLGGGDGFGGEATGENTTYSVSVKTAGGMALPEIDVYVYENKKQDNMVDYGKTDENGQISFNIPKSNKYAIVLSGTKKGYKVEDSYKFDGESAEIVLTSSLVTDEDLSTASLGVGDVMYDFTVMAADGKEIKLSDILKKKDLAVLNFWYTTCTWCLEEFPLIETVYQEYKDNVEIIALNPMEDNNVVKSFQEQNQLSFPMAACPASWANTFSVQGYPTTIMIDRYGVICVVESGAITSKRPWVSAFDHFTADDYKQMICVNGIADLVTQIKPNVEMPSSEKIAELINVGNINVKYHPETEDKNAEYFWPFIEGSKLGQSCIYASNKGVDDSYAIIYAEVELKKGQAVGFDYLVSSEELSDILYVIVDNEDIFQISGVSTPEKWQSCYPVVAEEDGTYEIALCFYKDSNGAKGDDTVYIDNMRVVNSSDIDVETYLPRQVATTKDGDTYTYANVVFNDKDGYYHVGSANGPLLLADLMNYTPFNEEEAVFTIVEGGDADKGGVSLYAAKEEGGKGMVRYFSYASNSRIHGLCTVNKELAEMLKQVAEVAGFENDANEWLKICKYYQSYGKNAKQLDDPIKGLATFSAYETKLGKNVPSNNFYYDRVVLPRGYLSKFVPSKSGVYRFTSKSDYEEGIDAWIYNAKGEIIYTYEHDERMYSDTSNCSMVYYMEAGKTYYIDMAFWDLYATGTINYDVEFIGASYKLFRACSPGYFTYDSNATGDVMYDIISGGITPVLKDGKYYESKSNSLIYADFTGITNIFDHSILEMIELSAFDFRKSETDHEILAYMAQNGNDIEKTEQYLKKLWGEEYDAYAESYQIEDIFAGRYHGDGPDLTKEMRAYAAKIDKSGTEKDGCVVVDKRLAEILQLLMDKYTFKDVDNSWIKICYYYDNFGK